MKYVKDKGEYVLRTTSEDAVLKRSAEGGREHEPLLEHFKKTYHVVGCTVEDHKEKPGHLLVRSVLERRSKAVAFACAAGGLLTHGTPEQIEAWVAAHPNRCTNGHPISIVLVDADVDQINEALENPAAFSALIDK